MMKATDVATVLDFAAQAVGSGWNDRTLRRFAAERGIDDDEARVRWPHGARDLGHALNAMADERMAAAFAEIPARSVGEVMIVRFEQNAALRPAVARLARSDLFHPIDTLRRTGVSGRLMWGCAGRSVPGRARRWRLVVVYCLAVLVWLADRSEGHGATVRVTRGLARLIGEG